MPFTLTYFLTAAAPSSVVAGDAGFPGSSAQLECDAEAFDQAHFLALIDRLYPEDYLRPLKTNADAGYEIFEATASVAERISTALHHVECGLVMLYAGGPAFATVEVIFYRENTNAGAVTVKSGTLVVASASGRAFELLADVAFGSGDLQVTGTVQAIAPGYEYNVPGQRTTAGAETLPGEIDTVETMLQDPSYGDASVKVRQEADAVGGEPDWLAGHGDNVGLVQGDGESADAFRLRMRSLPDTVTPAAMRRRSAAILGSVPWEFIETFKVEYVTCWDAPSPNEGTPSYQATPPTSPRYDSNLFVWDDPRDPAPYRGRWLSQDDYWGAFIVAVDGDTTVHDYGFALDDPGTTHGDFVGIATGKPRGTPAFDVPAPSGVFSAGVLDGPDIGWNALVATLYSSLQEAKAAGITAVVDYYHDW